MNTTPKKRKAQQAAEPRLVRKRVSSLKVAPENLLIYEKFDPKSNRDRLLTKSVKKSGIRVPIGVDADGVIVDGYRRWCAAKHLENVFVPCRVYPFRLADMTPDDRVALLRDFNIQREKTVAEKVRESLIDCDHEAAVRNLQLRRNKSENQYYADNSISPLVIALVSGQCHAIR